MALLTTPCGQEFSISPDDLNAGFTKDDMDRLIGGDCKAFRLKTGGLLLVHSLVCTAQGLERNEAATCLLRNALEDPESEVSGCSLLLGQDESDRLAPSERAALFLDRSEPAKKVLLLDRNEGVRSVMTLGLERDHFLVIQARTATEALEFCQSRSTDILVADVSSLRPHPVEVLQSIREAQPCAKVMLVSGYDEPIIASLYPGLLAGVEFLQKPFALNLLGSVVHRLGVQLDASRQLWVVANSKPDWEG